MPRVFILTLLLTFPRLLAAFGGSVPSGYPSTFMMGYVMEAHVDSAGRYVGAGSEFNTVDHYMAAIGTGWGATYKYLIGGPRAANGGNCWWNAYPGSGGMPTNFMNLANSRNYMPVFIYENLQGFTGNYPAGIKGAFDSATYMGQYFSDWADLMIKVDAWLTAHPGKVVTIDVEPDVWGYMQQNYGSNPASISAMVAGATNPGGAYPWSSLAAFPNTVQGAARAMLYIKDQRVAAGNLSRLKLAYHVSSWAVAPNPATQQGAVNIATHSAAIAGFVNACKSVSGSNWDLLFLDPADGDAALYQVNGLDAGGTTHWWDPTNVTQPTFDRYRDWVDALSGATSLRCMLWQMPIGNKVYKTLNNTHGHYQDNRAEYFLNPTNGTANICDWAAHGVIGILWGRGSIIPVGAAFTVGTGGPDYWYISWGTDYSGGTQDNITNAGPTGVNATLADDDGGYLRSRLPSYFSAPCVLPGVGTATPTQTASPNFSPTISPTHTMTPVCPGGNVDDLEDNNVTNAWGGTWSDYNPGGGSTMAPSPFAPSAAGAAGGSAYGARISGTVVGTGYPSLSMFLNAATGAQSVCGFNALRFSFKGSNAVTYRVQVHSAQEDTPTLEYNDYYFNVTGNGAWQTVTVPYGSFIYPGYGRTYALDCAQWRYLSWLPLQPGAYDLSVDDVQFICMVNTPTPSVTATFTPTPSRTPSPSATPSRTATASATPSLSPTFSGTRSATPSASPSFSASPTGTVSPTQTPSRTASPVASATVTSSVTSSRTASPSASATASVTPTRTTTPLLPSATPSHTPLPGSTVTSTGTVSPTRTATASVTASSSVTVTPSPTMTLVLPSATSSVTPLPGSSATFTSTVSPTLTASAPPSHTATASPSQTPAATLTRTATAAAPAPTASATPTMTTTPTRSATAAMGGPTNTPTDTPAASGGPGPNEVLDAAPVPQPNPNSFAVKLAGPCDRIEICAYSRAMVLLNKLDAPGSNGPGWVRVALPAEWGQFPNGAHYYTVRSLRGGQAGLKVKKGTMVVLK
jgi:hypothetical protein